MRIPFFKASKSLAEIIHDVLFVTSVFRIATLIGQERQYKARRASLLWGWPKRRLGKIPFSMSLETDWHHPGYFEINLLKYARTLEAF